MSALVPSPGEFPYTWFWHVLGSAWAALLPLSQNSYLHTGLYSRKGKGSVLSAHMSSHPRVPVTTLGGPFPVQRPARAAQLERVSPGTLDRANCPRDLCSCPLGFADSGQVRPGRGKGRCEGWSVSCCLASLLGRGSGPGAHSRLPVSAPGRASAASRPGGAGGVCSPGGRASVPPKTSAGFRVP